MTEAVNACAMHILSKYSTNWPLNHLENVFYIVSGYAYCTNRVLRKAAERKEKQGEGELQMERVLNNSDILFLRCQTLQS